jgi:glycosyltransferase involved in cell wall biosynthesis
MLHNRFAKDVGNRTPSCFDRRRPISCFVIAFNEADRIRECLAPLCGWVDQLIVLDSGSSDGTAAIAKEYTEDVQITDWPGFGAQRNRALAMCRHDWVLNIDADERISPAVKAEIDRVLSEPDLRANLIRIPWQTYLFGKPLRHGRYTSPQGKLFLKHGAHFKHASVHENLQMEERRERVLQSPLIHDSWRDYRHIQEKHLQYAALLAIEKRERGERGSIGYAVLRFFTDFLQQYVFRLGFIDGSRGFLMAVVLGQYAFHKYAALRAIELENDAANERSLEGQ